VATINQSMEKQFRPQQEQVREFATRLPVSQLQTMNPAPQSVNEFWIFRLGAQLAGAIGIVVGLAAAFAGTRVSADELHGVRPMAGLHSLGETPSFVVELAEAKVGTAQTQEARWNEVNAQALQLYKQGKYAEATPVAQEGLRVAEATFGEAHVTVAASAYLLANLYYEQRRYAEAEPLYKRSLAIYEKVDGPDHPTVAHILNNFAFMYSKQSRYAEAEPLYKRSLAIYEKALGPDHVDTALELNNLGMLYKDEGRYAAAEPLYQRSLRIYEKAFGSDNPKLATALNNLAALYSDQGRYAAAEPLYQRSLSIYEKAFGSDNPKLATALNNMGALYKDEGRYAEAEPLFRRALAIREKALGPDHPDVATSLDNLAALYSDVGRYAEAEPLYGRGLAIREKALGPEHPDVADSLNNLAALYEDQGRYAEVEPLFQRALAIREKVLGPGHPDVANSLNNLGKLYKDEGRYAEAEPLYQRALAIREKALGPEHRAVASSLDNLAVLYDQQGRYAEAEPLYQRALAIREKALGPEHPDVAIALNNLGELYRQQGRYGEAEAPLKRALAILEKRLGPDHPSVATALNNLATLYGDQARYGEAVPLLKRVLNIYEKALGPEHPHVATALNNLGEDYFHQGRYADAEPMLRRALVIREKALGPQRPLEGLALMNLAALLYAEAKPAQAEPWFDQAFETLAKQFQYYFTFMSEKERLAFLATVQYRIPEYFSFCLTYREKFPELTGKLYDTVLWEKGFIAQSAAALQAKVQSSGDFEALRLLNRLTEKKSELARLVSPTTADEPATPANERKQAERVTQIAELAQEANDLERELVKRSGTLAEEQRLARVTWQQVRDALGKDEAAVEVVSFPFYDAKGGPSPTEFVALVITPESTEPKMVLLAESTDAAGAAMHDYRLLVSGAGRTPALGSRFYEAFWRPLEGALGNAARVYFAADGVLNEVSLGVVPRGDGKLLMEAYDLHIVSSTKDLLRTVHSSAGNDALLVGDPQFLLSVEQHRAAVAQQRAQIGKPEAVMQAAPAPSASLAADTAAKRGECDPSPPQGGVLCPLPGTALEVQSIAALLREKNWQVVIDQQVNALEEAVKATQHPRVLHLSTHGFFLADADPRRRPDPFAQAASTQDPMLSSGLFFAGADRVLGGEPPLADADNGVLTAYEAATLNLQGTELVVLSACETGLGRTEAGEGVFGLRRALQEGGAESVLMSMWSVPDRETQELMTLFYRNWLSGMTKHEAFRNAQLSERETVKNRYGKDLPFYWGAFVLVGR
jgi:tetratricopeptide (TPR) repeat protein